jgi:hypothetical protein
VKPSGSLLIPQVLLKKVFSIVGLCRAHVSELTPDYMSRDGTIPSNNSCHFLSLILDFNNHEVCCLPGRINKTKEMLHQVNQEDKRPNGFRGTILL